MQLTKTRMTGRKRGVEFSRDMFARFTLKPLAQFMEVNGEQMIPRHVGAII